MKKLLMRVLVATALLGSFGCNTKTTSTMEKNTEIQDTNNEAAAENNAQSGYGGDPNNSGSGATAQPTDTANQGSGKSPE